MPSDGLSDPSAPAAEDRFGPGVHDVTGAARLLAVGDVQGNGDALRDLLEASGWARIDEGQVVWTAGPGVLLLLGDLLDGGAEPADVLWTVMGLREQAEKAGGQVVLVKGNHESMLLEAIGGDEIDELALRVWVANGGLETMARIAHRLGHPISETLLAGLFTVTLGGLDEVWGEALALVDMMRTELRPEIDFLRQQARPAALVNGCVLAVHGRPNFGAPRMSEFMPAEEEDATVWNRDWLNQWRDGDAEDPLAERLRAMKARLDSPPDGIALRHVLFAHTVLSEFEVPGLGGRQYRIGRLVPLERGVPALYDLITTPRAVAPQGALGALELSADGIVAVYGRAIETELGSWPQRERLADGDPGFRG